MISAFGVEDSRLSKAEKKPGAGEVLGGATGIVGGAALVGAHGAAAQNHLQLQRYYEKHAQGFRDTADEVVGSKYEGNRPFFQEQAGEFDTWGRRARKMKFAHLAGAGAGLGLAAGGTALVVHGDKKFRAYRKANRS